MVKIDLTYAFGYWSKNGSPPWTEKTFHKRIMVGLYSTSIGKRTINEVNENSNIRFIERSVYDRIKNSDFKSDEKFKLNIENQKFNKNGEIILSETTDIMTKKQFLNFIRKYVKPPKK